MKTTLELPDALIKQVKLRALHEGRKFKDAVADLLRRGLSVDADMPFRARAAEITRNRKTRLPVIKCKHRASPSREFTPERVAELLLNQEVRSLDGAGR